MSMNYPPLPGLYPTGWYWIARDNRVYSAPKMMVVDTSDPDYVTFVADGNGGTFWPDDADGNQTDAALDAVINPLGLYRDPKAELKSYAGYKRWTVETRGIVVNGHPLKTDADAQRKTAILASNYQNGSQTGTVNYKLADGTFIDATEADITAFNNGIAAHVQACYTAEGEANLAIEGGTCTTHDQVDEFFASIP